MHYLFANKYLMNICKNIDVEDHVVFKKLLIVSLKEEKTRRNVAAYCLLESDLDFLKTLNIYQVDKYLKKNATVSKVFSTCKNASLLECSLLETAVKHIDGDLNTMYVWQILCELRYIKNEREKNKTMVKGTIRQA